MGKTGTLGSMRIVASGSREGLLLGKAYSAVRLACRWVVPMYHRQMNNASLGSRTRVAGKGVSRCVVRAQNDMRIVCIPRPSGRKWQDLVPQHVVISGLILQRESERWDMAAQEYFLSRARLAG